MALLAKASAQSRFVSKAQLRVQHPMALLFALVLLLGSTLSAFAQPGTTINLKEAKPAEFAKKLLRSEKTNYGPLGKFQQFMQNTFTKFNYLYNANQRMKEILDKATTDYKEDYAVLLSYYPYDSKVLAGNAYLDSVIQHATAGILLHDLRNQYVDELYFLLGKAYYYQQKYDTAHQVFQYLNYAFAPKDDGYDLPIGSNISKVKDHFTILNPEHKGISKNSYARKERRNDGLIWQVKNYIQSGDYIQARVLLGYIEKDSLLPARLQPLVAETQGFLFYKLKKYDSAAAYLVKTDFNLYKRTVRPRMYYLTGQLFALGGDSLQAANYFAKAKSGALDPLLSIYSALAEASMKNTQDEQGNLAGAVSNNQDENKHMALLEKLSHRDKFRRYKDVIFYAQAAIALKNGDSSGGKALLQSSIQAGKKITPPNDWQKSRTYFALASLNYDENKFFKAAHFYDSVRSGDLSQQADQKIISLRQSPLNQVATHLDSIYYQDSLQHLAGLPEKERMRILKDKAKEIRKTLQQKEEDKLGNILNPAIRRPTVQATSLFPGTTSNGTIWYFNNQTLKNSGYQLFKQKFGNRPNVDNWQRLSALNGATKIPAKSATGSTLLESINPDGTLKLDSSNIQPEDLLKGLPLSDTAIKASNNKIASNLFAAGQILQNTLENFAGANYIYDSLMRRFPNWDSLDAVIFNQYICWTLLGKKEQAGLVKNNLQRQYPNSVWAKKLLSQDSLPDAIKETSLQNKATYAYNQVYQLFIAGAFQQADSLKQIADKQYGRYYWTPQLLYIESIYYIDGHQDSIAIDKLNYLLKHFPTSPIQPQAQQLLSILKRRSEIEAYLRQLRILPTGQLQNTRLATLQSAAAALADQRERRIGLLRNQKIQDLTDSSYAALLQLTGEIKEQPALISIKAPDKTSLNTDSVYTPSPTISKPDTAVTVSIVKTRPDSTGQPDNKEAKTNIPTPVEHQVAITVAPPAQQKEAKKDSLEKNDNSLPVQKADKVPTALATPVTRAQNTATIGGYTFNPATPQYVTVLLHKVAPVFASEAANAFNRYNLLAFEHEKWPVSSASIPENDLVQIGPFKDYPAAKAYLKQIQGVASTTIVPWLAQDKYEFIIVSPQNTNKLKSGEDLLNYQAAWKQFDAK